MGEARDLVDDLMAPKPWLYWLDFGVHAAIGWGAFAASLYAPLLSREQLLAFAIAVFALYRAAIFTHELAHLREGAVPGFHVVWNLVCGFPLLVPSFTYAGVHQAHHKVNVYGTEADGEYLPFGAGPPGDILRQPWSAFLLPGLLILRFFLLTPFSYVDPGLRNYLWERVSSLTIDPAYRRPTASETEGRTALFQELGAFVYASAATAAMVLGLLPARFLPLWFLLVGCILFVNSLRTLAAHAYRNQSGEQMSFADQFSDSVNVPGNPLLTSLWAPVGLRYHATHHLFPSMPYHSLGEAHRRLSTQLGDPAPYTRVTQRSLRQALLALWKDARESSSSEELPQGQKSPAPRSRHQ